MKNILNTVVITTLIFFISCGKDKTPINSKEPVVNVKVSTPISLFNTFFSASGKVESVQNATLSTRIMGNVTNVLVGVGENVSKGQLLITINNADILAQKAQLNASKTEVTAAFKNAEKDYNRYTELFKENSASQKELDDITANYIMYKARLEAVNQQINQINAQLTYANITAPFSGIITSKNVNKGDMTSPGMPLISIETLDNFQVTAMVPELEITSVKIGTKVPVLIKSTNEQVFGKIIEVSSSSKNTGGQFLVKILLDKTKIKLFSGMYTSIQFPKEKRTEDNNVSNLTIVPKNVLVKKGQLTGIYTIGNKNTAILRWLRVGKSYGNNIEILSGLSAQEQYIISADGKLFNGAKVSIQ